MKTLKFYSFYGKSFISKIIKFWTRSNISHIAIGLEKPWGYQLIEAWKNKKNKFKVNWQFTNLNNHKKGTSYDVWELEVSDGMYDFCMTQYESYAFYNLPYDWKAVFGFLFKTKNENKKGRTCSEGAITPILIYKNINSIIDSSKINPQDFLNLISMLGAKKVSSGRV